MKFQLKLNSKTMKNSINIILKSLLILTLFTACSSDDDDITINTVNILDVNFEQALIDKGYDTNGLNGNILKVDAEAVTDLNLNDKNIISLQGIEAFTNLKFLICTHNHLTSIDVSNNINLETLYCFNNQLTSLNISNNTNLTVLSCGRNELESLKIKNLNNVDTFQLNTLYNPNLNCIEVDDVNYSFNNWDFDVDSQVSFNVNCN